MNENIAANISPVRKLEPYYINDLKQVSELIDKVRLIFKYDSDINIRRIITSNPVLDIKSNSNGFYLSGIYFNESNNDSIAVTPLAIYYKPNIGNGRAIIEYKSFEELLSL